MGLLRSTPGRRSARIAAWRIRKENRASVTAALLIIGPILLAALTAYYNQAEQWSTSSRELMSGDCAVSHNASSHGTYPHEIFSDEQKNKGAIVFYWIGAIYCFVGLYFVCDMHFEPALDAVSEALSLSEDVAGATFMAAGSSAPELFTSIMGVFVARSDVGIGTIVGSAVFNMLCIIGLCAIYVAGQQTPDGPQINIQNNWYVVMRDIMFYIVSVLLLIIAITDQEVTWGESVMIFALYVVYVVWMKYNQDIGDWFHKKFDDYQAGIKDPKHSNAPSENQRKMLVFVRSVPFDAFMYIVITANIVVVILDFLGNDSDLLETINWIFIGIYFVEFFLKLYAHQFVGYFISMWNTLDGILVGMIVLELCLSGTGGISSASRGLRLLRVVRGMRSLRILRLGKVVTGGDNRTNPSLELDEMKAKEHKKNDKEGAITDDVTIEVSQNKPSQSGIGRRRMKRVSFADLVRGSQLQTPAKVRWRSAFNAIKVRNFVVDEQNAGLLSEEEQKDAEKSTEAKADDKKDDGGDDDDDEEYEPPPSPWEWPAEDSAAEKAFFVLTWVNHTAMYYTIPPCKKPGWEKWYLVSFFLSIIWISFYCWLMVWMAEVLGEWAMIPPPVMGLTFLAAGTSLPDALASLGVAIKGQADMAVANANGSNVFDICICLALPWLVATLQRGETVSINSEAMTLTVFVLFLIVAATIMVMKFEQWRLTARMGWVLVFLYVLFVIESLLLEYGIICP